jgi:Uma2 family endonuclease
MNVLAKPRLTVDEFLSWAVEQPGRHELFRGEVIGMSPETAGHAETKGAVYLALAAAVRRGRLPCHVLPDGMTVRIDDTTAFEPDALVYCGEKAPAAALEIPNPVVVVEVLSSSTRRIDLTHKLTAYFRLPSVMHYLIVDPTQPSVVHHARGTGDTILTRIVTGSTLALDPPGLTLALADIYGHTDTP